jgi:sulfatase maturation enzyme AslB (radical SAM superfamily)
VKDLIDNITKYNKKFAIEYLGGEPLLAFDLVKKATEYLETLHDIEVYDYIITTNGTVLNDEIIKWLKVNPKVKWHASLDGNKFMNQLRVYKNTKINTHDDVIKNCTILLNEIGSDRVGVHMVTHPYNIAQLSTGINHLYNKGIQNIGVGTIESTMTIDENYCIIYLLLCYIIFSSSVTFCNNLSIFIFNIISCITSRLNIVQNIYM